MSNSKEEVRAGLLGAFKQRPKEGKGVVSVGNAWQAEDTMSAKALRQGRENKRCGCKGQRRADNVGPPGGLWFFRQARWEPQEDFERRRVMTRIPIIIPTLEIRKLRIREAKSLA